MQTDATPTGASDVVLYRAVQNRRHRAATIAHAVGVVLLLTAGAGAQTINGLPESRFLVATDRLTGPAGQPLDIRFLTARELSAQAPRLIAVSRAALTLLQDWFGSPPVASLTIAGMPWHGPVHGTSAPGLVTAPVRWLGPVRDQSMERAVIGALARQYFTTPAAAPASFTESLVIFTATRAVHQLLEGSDFAAPRFFGGVVPFPLRSLLLSPPVNDPRPRVMGFAELAAGDQEPARGVRALQSLERYVGWPAMLDAISRLRSRDASAWTTETLGVILSDARGTDMRFLVQQLFQADAAFDYAVDGLQNRALASGQVESTITIARRGSGTFSIHGGTSDRDPAMPVLVRFADGSEFRDVFDGAASTTSLVYTATTAAVSAFVDPDVMLLLDANRDNNAIVGDAPASKLGVRLALHWLSWLQNAMMSYTALL